jgi:transposase
MRGSDTVTESLFSIKELDDFLPGTHPLRAIRLMVNDALSQFEDLFAGMYEDASKGGRPSTAPQKLMRAMLLQVLYSVRSERLLMEQVQCNLLFHWLSMDDLVWVPTVFTKNRQRLIEHDAVATLFNEVLAQAKRKNWLSKEHFSVGGTLIQAWASHKSFALKDEGDDDSDGQGHVRQSQAGHP